MAPPKNEHLSNPFKSEEDRQQFDREVRGLADALVTQTTRTIERAYPNNLHDGATMALMAVAWLAGSVLALKNNNPRLRIEFDEIVSQTAERWMDEKRKPPKPKSGLS
jgi:hypothetical protein